MVGSADMAPTGMMGFFQRAATGGQDRADAFALGERASILHHLDQPAIIPHVAESENKKFTYEVHLQGICKASLSTLSVTQTNWLYLHLLASATESCFLLNVLQELLLPCAFRSCQYKLPLPVSPTG